MLDLHLCGVWKRLRATGHGWTVMGRCLAAGEGRGSSPKRLAKSALTCWRTPSAMALGGRIARFSRATFRLTWGQKKTKTAPILLPVALRISQTAPPSKAISQGNTFRNSLPLYNPMIHSFFNLWPPSDPSLLRRMWRCQWILANHYSGVHRYGAIGAIFSSHEELSIQHGMYETNRHNSDMCNIYKIVLVLCI